MGITALVALTVYLCTIAPEVTVLSFGGILSTGAAYAGVPHPPGYPVWTLYSWCFIKLLPFSNIEWRVAVGSAVAAALACGVVALMVSRGAKLCLQSRYDSGLAPEGEGTAESSLESAEEARSRRREEAESLEDPRSSSASSRRRLLFIRLVCGLVAGLAVGFSSAVWRNAVRADSWALSNLLFAIVLCLLMRWMVSPGRTRFLCAAFFVFGLLLTSNQELIMLMPGIFLFVILVNKSLGRDLFIVIGILAAAQWRAISTGVFPLFASYVTYNVPLLIAFLLVAAGAAAAAIVTRHIGSLWKPAVACGVCLLLGLGMHFYLPIASMTNPPVNWGYPCTVDGFFHVLARGQYERAYPTHDLGQFGAQLWSLTTQAGAGFGWIYGVFAALPFCLLHLAGRSARKWLLGLAAIVVCVGPLLVAELNPNSDLQTAQLIEPYFSAMYIVVAILTGLGLALFADMVAEPARPGLSHRLRPI